MWKYERCCWANTKMFHSFHACWITRKKTSALLLPSTNFHFMWCSFKLNFLLTTTSCELWIFFVPSSRRLFHFVSHWDGKIFISIFLLSYYHLNLTLSSLFHLLANYSRSARCLHDVVLGKLCAACHRTRAILSTTESNFLFLIFMMFLL